jgi:RNA-splicing ligase RtcB
MLDEIEPEALQQIYNFLNCPAFEGAKIRIMPDVHAGAGAVIGFTSTLTDKIIPNVIGVDIGCGVLTVNLGAIQGIDFVALDNHIRTYIPSGFNVNSRVDPLLGQEAEVYRRVARETEQDEDRVLKSLKSLGGGNHYLEVGRDQNGNVWVTLHSGSRNFGLKIANWHQAKAVKTVGKGRGLEWLEGERATDYLEHMKIAQQYAAQNRRLMAEEILKFFGKKLASLELVESVHNYINFQDRILRKGAISAHEGERVVIPWNMRDGMILGRGKGNPEWNFSAPHGAGRVMGRGQAKRTLDLEDFKKTMDGIWTSCVNKDTLDESPMVYKDPAMIQAAIADTVDIELTVKPLYNFKASEEGKKAESRKRSSPGTNC